MDIFILLIVFVAVLCLVVYIANRPNEKKKQELENHADELLRDAEHLLLLAEVRRQAEEHGDADTVKAVYDMTYDGPMPVLQEDGTYSSVYSSYMKFDIAGINFRKGIADYVGKSRGYIQPEPKNSHDPNAIAIYCEDGHHLGYIKMDETDDVRDLGKEFPIPVLVEIEEDFDYDENRKYYHGEIMIEL